MQYGISQKFLETYSLFPLDLGAGSLIGGGDEFYMYLQVVKHGFRIRHVPEASVHHFLRAATTNRKPATCSFTQAAWPLPSKCFWKRNIAGRHLQVAGFRPEKTPAPSLEAKGNFL